MRLEQHVAAHAVMTPDALAVCGPDARLSYRELDVRAATMADDLVTLGVRGGDRVALWVPKSVFGVVATQATLRLGATYVPLDPRSPVRRVAALLADCTPAAVVTTAGGFAALNGAGAEYGQWPLPALLAAEDLASWSARPGPLRRGQTGTGEDIAYVLYTSGSTGTPKGVCVTHTAAAAFVDWAAGELEVTHHDRLANHAPLQFDLSVFDLYAAFRAGASVHLVPETTSARNLVRFIVSHDISVWYSVPSALTMMIEFGGLLDLSEPPMRVVVFAGEVFPVDYLKALRNRWSSLILYNFYGPTETNVCAYHRVSAIARERTTPVPIGTGAAGDELWAVRTDGSIASPGQEGELMVAGPTLMTGYLNATDRLRGPYATGDIVRSLPEGGFEYVGRRDHMVKIRGHRVEPGEIEAALHTHPDVVDAAVTVVGSGHDARLRAWLTTRSANGQSLGEIKRFLAERLPPHLVVDSVRTLTRLPRTSNGKVDRRSLDEPREEVILVTDDGAPAGTMPKSSVHTRATPLHLAFSCYVFDHDGNMLVTRRATSKATWPGVLTNSCCGHPQPGEDLLVAAARRLREELGVAAATLAPILPRFRYRAVMDNGIVENELCPVLRATTRDQPVLEPTEVAEATWMPWARFVAESLSDGREFSPWCRLQTAELVTLGSDPLCWPSADSGSLPAAARLDHR